MSEKALESPLDCKEIQPVHPKGNQSWILSWNSNILATWLRRTDTFWKDPDAGKDWRQEEKGMTEDEMVGWHHRFNGHGFGWTPGVGDGQGGLACCIHGVAKSQTWLSDWTELNWTEKINKIDKLLARLMKRKERRIKSTKLEMKKERLQQTMQKYKGL